MDLSVSIQMAQPVTAVSSPTHPIAMTLGSGTKEVSGDFQPNKAFVYLHEEKTFLEKDVVILVSSPKLDFPRCTVERDFPSGGVQEITDAYALTFVPRFNLPPLPVQEYSNDPHLLDKLVRLILSCQYSSSTEAAQWKAREWNKSRQPCKSCSDLYLLTIPILWVVRFLTFGPLTRLRRTLCPSDRHMIHCGTAPVFTMQAPWKKQANISILWKQPMVGQN
jgi:hypothetical protein